jgi:hypothetical protein
MGGASSIYGEMENAFKLCVGKPLRKRPLGSTKRRWEGNNKVDFKVIWC